MSSAAFEAYLVRLYVDEEARDRFLRDPRSAATAAGLSAAECAALERIDREGLVLAAASFARKRGARPPRRWWRRRWRRD